MLRKGMQKKCHHVLCVRSSSRKALTVFIHKSLNALIELIAKGEEKRDIIIYMHNIFKGAENKRCL